jgi:RNA polymerase sigma-70 factor (ECF subfamily)
MSESTDQSLVERTLDGDEHAFERLVERYEKTLFHVALRMVGDFEEARDITQTTFVRAYEKLDGFDPRFKFFSWIFKILVNESRNILRKKRKHEPLREDLVSPRKAPDEVAHERLRGEMVQRAILDLSVEHRQVILLRHFGELSYREMGWVLDVPEKTVKSRLFTARRRLCDILTELGVTA